MIEDNRYTFEVAKKATKPQIAHAIEEIFAVDVTKVNTMNVNGKPRRLRYSKGLTRSWKKAIVTLKQGDVDRPVRNEVRTGADGYVPVRYGGSWSHPAPW